MPSRIEKAGVEVGLGIWDAYQAGATMLDYCSTLEEKIASGGGFVFGMIAPGGGYGAGSKAVTGIAKNTSGSSDDLVGKVQ